jgi:hypothetical protein
MIHSYCHGQLTAAATGGFPAGRVSDFLGVAAGLLAVAIGVYAFVPLILELAMQRRGDPDDAARHVRRADRCFDLLLGSVVALGASLCLGLVATYVHARAIYICQVGFLAAGILVLLIGTVALGWTLRTVRRGA